MGLALTGGLGPISTAATPIAKSSSLAGGAGTAAKMITTAKGINSPFVRELGKATLQGILVDFVGFKAEEGNVFNAVKELGNLTEGSPLAALAYSDEESPLLGRLKNTITGAGLGVSADILAQGVRMAWSFGRLQLAMDDFVKATDNADNLLKNIETYTDKKKGPTNTCLLYTSPSPRDS